MQAGMTFTDSGFASLGIGVLNGITWSNCSVEFASAVLAGSASSAVAGQVGALCGGVSVTEATKAFTISVDENCRLLGEYDAAYYDYTGVAQMIDITPMTAGDLTSRSGAVKILNDNATTKEYVTWVRGKTYPELSLFCTEAKAGLTLFFR